MPVAVVLGQSRSERGLLCRVERASLFLQETFHAFGALQWRTLQCDGLSLVDYLERQLHTRGAVKARPQDLMTLHDVLEGLRQGVRIQLAVDCHDALGAAAGTLFLCEPHF